MLYDTSAAEDQEYCEILEILEIQPGDTISIIQICISGDTSEISRDMEILGDMYLLGKSHRYTSYIPDVLSGVGVEGG